MFYVGANGKYPLVCGDNTGHHVYLNVQGRASTDLTFILNNIQEKLYTCPDKFNVLGLEADAFENGHEMLMRGLSNPAVNLGKDNIV